MIFGKSKNAAKTVDAKNKGKLWDFFQNSQKWLVEERGEGIYKHQKSRKTAKKGAFFDPPKSPP
jgi:hypothetical protein